MHKWISVKDRLPEDGQQVIIFIFVENGAVSERGTSSDYKDMKIAHHQPSNRWYSYDNGMVSSHAVTHWMPLPEPPEQN